MNNEYIIVNKTALLKMRKELKKEYANWDGRIYNSDYQKGQVDLIDAIISFQSTPLIPENIKPLQELIDEGYDPYHSAHHLQVQRMLKVIQEYLSKLKLDI